MENLHKNYKTGYVYRGANQSLLNDVAIKRGYSKKEWLTFLQAKEAGLKILKGSKSVVLYKKTYKEEKDEYGRIIKERKFNGFFRVFNIECTEKYAKA